MNALDRGAKASVVSADGVRAVALDLDGTVIRPDLSISRRTLRAVAAARRAGLTVVVATGRRRGSALAYARELRTGGPTVASDGALVLDAQGRLLYARPMAAAAVEELIARAEALGIALAVQTELRVYWSRPRSPWAFLRQARARGLLRRPSSLRHVLWELRLPLGRFADLKPHREPVYKVVPFGPAGPLEALREELGGLPLRATAPPGAAFEVVAEGCSKGAGLGVLLGLLGIRPEQVVAIGDSHNDREMFALVGYPVAMPRAPEAVRRAARWLAPPVEEDGAAQVLEALAGGRFSAWTRAAPAAFS